MYINIEKLQATNSIVLTFLCQCPFFLYVVLCFCHLPFSVPPKGLEHCLQGSCSSDGASSASFTCDVLIPLSFLKGSFAKYRIPVWLSPHHLLASVGSARLAVKASSIPYTWQVAFLTAFKILFVRNRLPDYSVSWYEFLFFPHGVHWASWIYRFIS